jgi:hypothetical protein
VTPREEEELRALVDQAYDLRGNPYFTDAIHAIVDWHERRHMRRREYREAHVDRLVALMRETDPRTIGRKAAA